MRLIPEPAAAIEGQTPNREDLIAMRRAGTHFRVAHEMGTPVWKADIEFHQAIAAANGDAR